MLDELGRPQLLPPARGVVVSAVCWDAPGERLLLGLAHNAVLRLQLRAHDEIATLITQGHGGGRISRTPSDASFARATNAGATATRGEWSQIRSLAEHPREPRFASVGDDGVLKVWSLKSHTLIACRRLTSRGLSVAFSPDALHIVAGCSDGSLAVFDVTTSQLAGRASGRVTTPALRLVLTRRLNVAARATAARAPQQESGPGVADRDADDASAVVALAFSPCGRRLAAAVGTLVMLMAVHSPDGNVERSFQVRAPCLQRLGACPSRSKSGW